MKKQTRRLSDKVRRLSGHASGQEGEAQPVSSGLSQLPDDGDAWSAKKTEKPSELDAETGQIGAEGTGNRADLLIEMAEVDLESTVQDF